MLRFARDGKPDLLTPLLLPISSSAKMLISIRAQVSIYIEACEGGGNFGIRRKVAHVEETALHAEV